MTIAVLIVDDQALLRGGFRVLVESAADMTVVGEAADGTQAVSLAREHRPDVVLMDVRMPRMDGVEATRRLTEQSDVKVLILTTFDLDAYLFDAVRAGASGFLLKDVPPDDLIEAVRAVARGDALIEPRMTRRLLDEFARQPAPGAVANTPELGTLTQRELEVLRAVARGLSNAEIAEELYISETTVKTHITHILQKLGLRDRVQVVVLAYQTGLAR